MQSPASLEQPSEGTWVSLDQLLGLRFVRKDVIDTGSGRLSMLAGQVVSRKRGEGLEFDDLRPYLPGDDVRFIDWNVSARAGETHVRIHRTEHERATTVVADLSPAAFTGIATLRAVSICFLATSLLWRNAARGDKLSMGVFDGDRLVNSKPGVGDRGALPGIGALAEIFSACRAAAPKVALNHDPALLFERLARLGRLAGNLHLVSHFDYPPDTAMITGLGEIARRHDLTLYWIRDRYETTPLPPGRYPYRADGAMSEAWVGPVASRRALGDDLAGSAEQFRESLRNREIRLYEIESGADAWLIRSAVNQLNT